MSAQSTATLLFPCHALESRVAPKARLGSPEGRFSLDDTYVQFRPLPPWPIATRRRALLHTQRIDYFPHTRDTLSDPGGKTIQMRSGPINGRITI